MPFDQILQIYEMKAAEAQQALADIEMRLGHTLGLEDRNRLEECRKNLLTWLDLYKRTLRLIALCATTSSNISDEPVRQELKKWIHRLGQYLLRARLSRTFLQSS